MKEQEKFNQIKKLQNNTGSISNNKVRKYKSNFNIKYPFKVLLLLPEQELWLGGDRAPLQITQSNTLPNINLFSFYGLKNDGNNWIAGYFDNLLNPNKVFIFNPTNEKDFTVASGTGFNLKYAGNGRFIDGLGGPSIQTSPQYISGSPGQQNYELRLNYTATLLGLAPFPPYSSTPLPMGFLTNKQIHLFDGIATPNYVDPLQWTSRELTNTWEGTIQFPVKAFQYNIDLNNPSEDEGTRTIIKTHTINEIENRSQDFSTIDIIISEDKLDSNILTIDHTLIGNQKITASVNNLISETYSLTDTRSTGSSGAVMSWESQRITATDTIRHNPIFKIIFGDRCVLCVDNITGVTQTVTQDDSRSVTSTTETIGFNPSMQSPTLSEVNGNKPFGEFGVTGYIVSVNSTSQGANGGWFNGGTAFPGDLGEDAPTPMVIARYGDPYTTQSGQIRNNGNFFGAYFDAVGAYGDNFIAPSFGVWSRYTATYAPPIINGWDNVINNWKKLSNDSVPTDGWFNEDPVTVKNYNRNYEQNVINTTIIEYPKPFEYWLFTETEKIEIEEEVSYIRVGINSSIVTAPSIGNSGTLSISNGSGLSIRKSRLIREERVSDSNTSYLNGSDTLNFNTRTDTTYFVEPLEDIIGLQCEVFLLQDGQIIRWKGSVSSYTSTPGFIPPLSGSNFTNTIIGGEFDTSYNINSLNISIITSEIVPFCPFELQNERYTVVINPNFAGITVINPDIANIKLGSGNTIATAYVSNKSLYQDGNINYASVWNFNRQTNGKIKILMRDNFVKGKTKSHQENASILAVQYWSR